MANDKSRATVYHTGVVIAGTEFTVRQTTAIRRAMGQLMGAVGARQRLLDQYSPNMRRESMVSEPEMVVDCAYDAEGDGRD